MKTAIPFLIIILILAACSSSPKSHAQETRQIYRVGDTGPAGGIVFYDSGDSSGDWQYLEAAPAEFEFSANWNSANEMVGLLNINGFTDWRMPTRDELNFMYLNLRRRDLGNFTNDSYWSSTEERALLTFTMYQNFGNGLILGADRLGRNIVSHKVRAVREF